MGVLSAVHLRIDTSLVYLPLNTNFVLFRYRGANDDGTTTT